MDHNHHYHLWICGCTDTLLLLKPAVYMILNGKGLLVDYMGTVLLPFLFLTSRVTRRCPGEVKEIIR